MARQRREPAPHEERRTNTEKNQQSPKATNCSDGDKPSAGRERRQEKARGRRKQRHKKRTKKEQTAATDARRALEDNTKDRRQRAPAKNDQEEQQPDGWKRSAGKDQSTHGTKRETEQKESATDMKLRERHCTLEMRLRPQKPRTRSHGRSNRGNRKTDQRPTKARDEK